MSAKNREGSSQHPNYKDNIYEHNRNYRQRKTMDDSQEFENNYFEHPNYNYDFPYSRGFDFHSINPSKYNREHNYYSHMHNIEDPRYYPDAHRGFYHHYVSDPRFNIGHNRYLDLYNIPNGLLCFDCYHRIRNFHSNHYYYDMHPHDYIPKISNVCHKHANMEINQTDSLEDRPRKRKSESYNYNTEEENFSQKGEGSPSDSSNERNKMENYYKELLSSPSTASSDEKQNYSSSWIEPNI